MKIEVLKERIEKNEVKIEKKINLINKKQKQLAKLSDYMATTYGIDINAYERDWEEERRIFGEEGEHDIYWTMCDIYGLQDDIRRNTNQIEEIKEVISNQQKQLAKEVEKEETFINEVPETMKELEKALIKEWNAFDKARQSFLHDEYKLLGYDEFIKEHKYAGYQFMHLTEEEIDKANRRDARLEILDLLNRVKKITGEVTDWNGIRLTNGNSFPVLNGTVIGKEGNARVESILAGGYNIQRLHIRTLVHEF